MKTRSRSWTTSGFSTLILYTTPNILHWRPERRYTSTSPPSLAPSLIPKKYALNNPHEPMVATTCSSTPSPPNDRDTKASPYICMSCIPHLPFAAPSISCLPAHLPPAPPTVPQQTSIKSTPPPHLTAVDTSALSSVSRPSVYLGQQARNAQWPLLPLNLPFFRAVSRSRTPHHMLT